MRSTRSTTKKSIQTQVLEITSVEEIIHHLTREDAGFFAAYLADKLDNDLLAAEIRLVLIDIYYDNKE